MRKVEDGAVLGCAYDGFVQPVLQPFMIFAQQGDFEFNILALGGELFKPAGSETLYLQVYFLGLFFSNCIGGYMFCNGTFNFRTLAL